MDKIKNVCRMFPQDVACQILLKSVDVGYHRVIQKIKRLTFFETQCINHAAGSAGA